MDIKEFVEGYKNLINKDNYVKKHITNNYVSYATKVEEISKIVYATTHKKLDNGKTVYMSSSAVRSMLFELLLIKLYTDIEFEMNYENYDILESNCIIKNILGELPNDEYTNCTRVLNYVVNDAYENERTLSAYIDKSLNSIDALANQLMEE